MSNYLGIDIGSISIKYVILSEDKEVIEEGYYRTHGDAIAATKKLLESIQVKKIDGICTTGSARKFIGQLISADTNIDEITAHRTAIKNMYKTVRTIFEIGGQDSKLIYFTDKSVNFEMNNVCAAGTGSFLDQQASRLGLSIEEFCKKGLNASDYHKIASKCTVFAETDMIHAQQSGIPIEKIIKGVHKGMVNNYFAQLCAGKDLKGDFLFEGGTSENQILIQSFLEKLKENGYIESDKEFIVPVPYNKIIGAIGAAMICMKKGIKNIRVVPRINEYKYIESGECYSCPNKCGAKIIKILINGKILTLGKSCQE